MIWSKYNYEYKSRKHGRLLFNYLTGVFLDLNDDEVYEMVHEIKRSPDNYDFSSDPDLKTYLLDNGIIAEKDEDNEDILYYRALRSRTQTLYKTITIVPTIDCNLTCPYCFEGVDKKKKYMSKKVVDAVKDYIDKTCVKTDTRHISLLWFGGEPLLAFDTIKEITHYVKDTGIPFYTDITTNGTLLTEDKLAVFEDLNVKQIQITFDGPKESHDAKRAYRNGKGTFDQLMSKSEMLEKYVIEHPDFIVHLRINVDLINKDNCADLYLTFREQFPHLHVYFAPIKQYSTCSSAVDCFSGDEDVLDYMIDLYYKYGIDVIDFDSVMRGMRPCMAECEGSVIIGPDGETYVCLNDVGNLKESSGNIVTGEINPELVSRYRNARLTAYNPSCQKCKILWLCGGGCPHAQYRNKTYNEHNDTCTPVKRLSMLHKYLDVRYEIKTKINNHE